MKTFFVAVFFTAICFCAYGQKDKPVKSLHDDIEKMSKQLDSSRKAFDSSNTTINDSYNRTMDSINNHLRDESNERNLNAFVRMQKEQEAKAKKAMWIRLGLGTFFLGVLIFGLMRRRKKVSQ